METFRLQVPSAGDANDHAACLKQGLYEIVDGDYFA